MAKQRLVVSDDQVLVDVEVIFEAIREAKGDWQQVEKEFKAMLVDLQQVVGTQG